MLIAGIIGFILLLYIVGFLASTIYRLTLPSIERSLMMFQHPTLTSLMWFIFIPFYFLCNGKFIDKKYVLWYIFLYFSCLFNWISKVFCSIFACLLLKSFWGLAVGWISFTVLYWIFLVLIPKSDRQHMVSSFQDYLSNTSMGIPPIPFLPKHVIDKYEEEYKNDNVNAR